MPRQPFRYVTFDETGSLTGCYFQVPPPQHVEWLIEVDETFVWTWTLYCASADRLHVQLIAEHAEPDPGKPAAK